MSMVFYSVVSFIVGLGLLIAIHEFGHFWVARKLGVKVLRYSIGFGRPIWRSQKGVDDTEYVVAMVPLGGYVKMLDEREGPVAPDEQHRAFNRQSLKTRCAIVAAGPLANFIFAVIAYWAIFVMGIPGLKPIAGDIQAGSTFAQAGMLVGDEMVSIDGKTTPTLEVARLALIGAVLSDEGVELQVRRSQDELRVLFLNLQGISLDAVGEGDFLQHLGFTPIRPHIPPVIAQLQENGAALQAGFHVGDRVLYSDGEVIKDWMQWAKLIRKRPGQAMQVVVERGNEQLTLTVVPQRITTDNEDIGRVGVSPEIPSNAMEGLTAIQQYSVFSAVSAAIVKTWDMSILTLKMMWKMLVGEASLDNISGPITIASYAGQTAQIGIVAFLSFLAIVSVSLGVLNLLPIPILDGGHLLYYGIEFIKGAPVSEQTQLVGQKIGIIMLGGLMFLAVFNDINRLFG